MNIKEASQQIQGAVRAYLAKDARGMYRIPFRMQRPLILMGPPGVGKTAVVEQIAAQLDINFVSYSITHHTRQSALGLPFIAQESFDGVDYRVSEYTMSEIIAAVHHAIERSGVKEGILFLDEINCVSETLAPAMLQFLQYKTFGMHALPEGWVIVTAGNPPEYNRAAREFDPAMLDRLMKLDIEPELAVWQEYAVMRGIHPAITTYLEAKPGNFYNVRANARGSKIVTSRGWEDLSRMLQAYEAEGIAVPDTMAQRYVQDPEIAEDFSVYYELFCKYQDDYKVQDILAGQQTEEVVQRAQDARFDERIALVGLLLDAVLERARLSVEREAALKLVRADVLGMKALLESEGCDAESIVRACVEAVESASDVGQRQKVQVGDYKIIKAERLLVLQQIRAAVASEGANTGATDSFEVAKAAFNAACKEQKKLQEAALAGLDNSFAFLDGAFGQESQEALIFVTKLSADPALIDLVARHGSRQFLQHNKSLLFTERELDLLKEVETL